MTTPEVLAYKSLALLPKVDYLSTVPRNQMVEDLIRVLVGPDFRVTQCIHMILLGSLKI